MPAISENKIREIIEGLENELNVGEVHEPMINPLSFEGRIERLDRARDISIEAQELVEELFAGDINYVNKNFEFNKRKVSVELSYRTDGILTDFIKRRMRVRARDISGNLFAVCLSQLDDVRSPPYTFDEETLTCFINDPETGDNAEFTICVALNVEEVALNVEEVEI